MPNGLELCCPAEAGRYPSIVAHAGRPASLPFVLARRVSFSELLGAALRVTYRWDACPSLRRGIRQGRIANMNREG
jgi:hypothetical protein